MSTCPWNSNIYISNDRESLLVRSTSMREFGDVILVFMKSQQEPHKKNPKSRNSLLTNSLSYHNSLSVVLFEINRRIKPRKTSIF